jgi:hypothetical protein
LSFSSSEELNSIIDKKLPNGLPQFVREEVEFAGQKYEFYHRDILKCIRVLYGDPEFSDFLAYAPEKHYTGPEKNCRVFSEMNSGRWWWTRQVGRYHLPRFIANLTTFYRKSLKENLPGSQSSQSYSRQIKRELYFSGRRLHIQYI